MKLGVLTVALSHLSLENALSYLHEKGVQAVEIGAGGFPGKAHLDPEKLLGNDAAIQEIKGLLQKYEMEISALSTHGNAVHPDKKVAEEFHRDFENTVLLAEALGVDTVITFSGCPGDSAGSKYPNWVTCPWPDDFLAILEYQWNAVLIPYWKKEAEFAKSHGVTKIAFEMHPGFCVYNPETLLRLRGAVGDIIGANFDPSHLGWQGMNPVEAIRTLGGAIHHFHAKDTFIDKTNAAKNGNLDTKPYSDIPNRSWTFRTVGYGSDVKVWKDMLSMLRTVGYDGAISIEHEDALMSAEEGLCKAIAFLKDILIYEKPGEMYWA
ncbi:MAG: sugar phosphate isomerase/epimerase [Ruminococcaceae bacterium]|nr:sugar phosphate isomerase/epimerase [Oscillospiraceae bacterium]